MSTDRINQSPAIPPLHRPASLNRPNHFFIGLVIILASFLATLLILRLFGLFYPFYIPTGSMKPAASAGDHVTMQGLSYLAHDPQRGDIVVFNADDIPQLQPTFYIKRVVGEPGEHVRLSGGELFINDNLVNISNAVGKIIYNIPPGKEFYFSNTNMVVPDGCYFLLGDNSTNSLDSRYFGCVPRKNIKGCLFFCYWPPSRIGSIK